MPDIFENMVALVKKEIPNFEVKYKNESLSSKILGILVWLFNRHYMTRYTTTRYPCVYFPSRKFVKESPSRAVKILAHEFVHLVDRKRCGFWFTLSYGLPQIAALVFLLIPAIVAFVQPWWVALLTAIPAAVCLLPLPAYWRMKWEMRGYAMNVAIDYWHYGSVQVSTLAWIATHFTGWDYYKMWPFKKNVMDRLSDVVDEIKQNQVGYPFREVKQFVKNQWK